MDPLFDSHKLNEAGKGRVIDVRYAFEVCLKALQPCIEGSGRYESLVKTKLEEACMMAVKGVAVQPANQEH